MGYRVIGIDTGAEKKALATKLGAEAFIDFKTTKVNQYNFDSSDKVLYSRLNPAFLSFNVTRVHRTSLKTSRPPPKVKVLMLQ